jgi:uncharacterized membrane protein
MHMNQSTPTSKVSSKNDVESNKLFAALSYLWILSAIFLLFKKDSPFIQFHAKQGLVLFIFGWLLQIVVFAFVVTGIVTAFQGKWFKLPLVSSLAEKINF